jgi:2-dehydro-3-deoxy-D-arabinonate dehydratase
MKIYLYQDSAGKKSIVADNGSGPVDLTGAGLKSLTDLLNAGDPLSLAKDLLSKARPFQQNAGLVAAAPVEQQEIWAAGVTYLRSKKARMEESDFSATAYDKVYEAPRPEIFFKSMPHKAVGSGESVGIRRDAKWNVPEPELALVFNASGALVGFTICNDMSSRDIEGENLLYLPQAKIYERSCAIGPCIVLGASEETARSWSIDISINRAGSEVFRGNTSVGQIKRSFSELQDYLFRSQRFPHGAILSTGTGIVPPDSFTLQAGDEISITISGIGTLKNRVEVV